MSDATIRTLRTIVQGSVTVLLWMALYVPPLLTDLGITRDSWEGVGILLTILATVTRLSQTGIIDKIMTEIGLGRDRGRHEI